VDYLFTISKHAKIKLTHSTIIFDDLLIINKLLNKKFWCLM